MTQHSPKPPPIPALLALLLALAGAPPAMAQMAGEQPMVEVTLPELTGEAVIGARVFAARCASCHGANAAGNAAKGPPLIHVIYEPSHHGDEAFHRAATVGVAQHHWPFGDMPPVEGVTRAEVQALIAYVRQVQVANGIR